MLRIGVNDVYDTTTLTIEGKLTAPFATELESCWRTAIAANPSKAIVVNLTSVTFVDSVSRDLLVRMRRQGAKLVPTGCLMTAIVERIEAEIASDIGECKTTSFRNRR